MYFNWKEAILQCEISYASLWHILCRISFLDSRRIDNRKMIISYYALNRNNDENLFVFQSLHEDTMLKEFYNRAKSKQIETNLYFLNDSILPFMSTPKILYLLQTKNLKSLLIVVIDDEIVKLAHIWPLKH